MFYPLLNWISWTLNDISKYILMIVIGILLLHVLFELLRTIVVTFEKNTLEKARRTDLKMQCKACGALIYFHLDDIHHGDCENMGKCKTGLSGECQHDNQTET